MTIARVYRMTARETKGDALANALADLRPQVLAVDGCIGVDSFRDIENRNRFLFIEKWVTVEAHKAAAGKIGADVMQAIGAALAEAPEGSYEEMI